MILRYIYIKEYHDTVSNLNLNFGGNYKFKYENGYLKMINNDDYVKDLYKDYNCISDITAIIGKNSSGKTTALRIINAIFAEVWLDLEYIIVFESDTKMFCYFNLKGKKDINICNDGVYSVIKINLEKNFLVKKINEKIKLVYFSSIFDKSKALLENDSLLDISTNDELRKYIKNELSNNKDNLINRIKYGFDSKIESEKFDNSSVDKLKESIRKLYKDNMYELSENFSEELDLIDEFKKSEISKKINYYIKSKKKREQTGFNPLFKYPESIKISFGDYDELKTSIIIEISNTNKNTAKLLKEVKDETDKLLDNAEINEDSKNMILKIQYKNEFLSMLVFEVFYNLIVKFEVSIDDVMNIFIEYVHKADLVILEDFIFKVLNSILERKQTIIDKESQPKFVYIESANINLVTKINDSIMNIEKFEEALTEDEYTENFEEDIDLVINDIKSLIEMCYDSLDIVNNNNINVAINGLNRVLEEFGKYIDFKDLENDSQAYNFDSKDLEDDFEVYNFDTYFSDGILDFLSRFNKLLNYLLNSINDINKVKINKDEKFDCEESGKNDHITTKMKEYEIDFVESNDDIISYIGCIKELVQIFLNLVDNNFVTKGNDNIFNLEIKWTSNDVSDFIEKFTNNNFDTFYVVFDQEDLSTGHRAYLDMYSRMYDLIDKCKITEADKYIILLIDEGDIYLHPDIQISFVKNLLEFLKMFFVDKQIQIIFTSNSPFIISDIPNTNIIYLENYNKIETVSGSITEIKTFGANIHNLLMNNFFMKNGTIGLFAQDKIDYIIKLLNEANYKNVGEDEKKNILQLINLIGETLIRRKLLEMYENVFGSNVKSIDDKITYYQKKIDSLRKIKKEKNKK